ncbi:MAG: Holliday junction branch migration protein RuvA [Phycisphaerales bacterium]
MLSRIVGILDAVDPAAHEALIRPDGLPLTLQVLVPGYLARSLLDRIGQTLTLHTHLYLEGQGQGSSFVPRLLGFGSPDERRFFELLTSVEGLGNRRALRVLAEPPADIARAIASEDAAWLTRLPEIGKKTAEKVILELKTKVKPFAQGVIPPTAAKPRSRDGTDQAIAGLIALGQTRGEAQRLVRDAIDRNPALKTPEDLIAAALGAATP